MPICLLFHSNHRNTPLISRSTTMLRYPVRQRTLSLEIIIHSAGKRQQLREKYADLWSNRTCSHIPHVSEVFKERMLTFSLHFLLNDNIVIQIDVICSQALYLLGEVNIKLYLCMLGPQRGDTLKTMMKNLVKCIGGNLTSCKAIQPE